MKFYHSKLLNLATNVTHAFTTKTSGNLAFHVNDIYENVVTNHQTLAKELGFDINKLVHMKQIHSSTVHIVDDKNNFTNPKECDALITSKKDTPLMVMVADCSPILFYDKVNQVIAVAHAGRQGTFKNIVANTIEQMQNNFHSKAIDISVSIGPSIGQCCYEVGDEIYDEAKQLGLEYALEKQDKKYHLDISLILNNQLRNCSIKEKNIEISKECTCCKSDTYYSYRAKAQTGRFAGVIMLK